MRNKKKEISSLTEDIDGLFAAEMKLHLISIR